MVLQYNKRDLANIYSIEELNKAINKNNLSYFESIAVTGHGVFNTLKAITKLVIEDVKRKLVAAEKESVSSQQQVPPMPSKIDAPPVVEKKELKRRPVAHRQMSGAAQEEPEIQQKQGLLSKMLSVFKRKDRHF